MEINVKRRLGAIGPHCNFFEENKKNFFRYTKGEFQGYNVICLAWSGGEPEIHQRTDEYKKN